ncbi:hypothetical protein JHK87_049250 [Glycine soja]|nr:hypothetical protein JHK87_049250 [Glycine soja]
MKNELYSNLKFIGADHELLELATSFQSPPDTGLPCDFNRSTCGGRNELVYSQGPGYPDELESTRIIGERQFRKAVDLFNAADEEIEGGVDFRHAYIDFSQLEVTISDQGYSEVVKTCPAAMGFAFSARTTDGPGAFDFQQGDDKGNPFWKLVRDMLKTPSKEQTDCQCPKPILLDTGEMKKPYDWALDFFWKATLIAITHKLIALGLRGSVGKLP